MAEDALAKRGQVLEEEYFRARDRKLVEKLREAAAAEEARGEMKRRTGVDDPALLSELQELGFTPDTVGLLPFVPVLEMAWLEGGVTKAERDLILQLAKSRGINDDSPAGQKLQQWTATRPEAQVFERAGRLIRAMISSGTGQTGDGLTVDDLVKHCEQIASASGGIFGIGRVSADERALLSRITEDLKTRHG